MKTQKRSGSRNPFRSPGVWWIFAACALVCGLVLSWVNCRMGPLNQDEGWYLLAAQNVCRGMRVYHDFVFTQGPLFPWVYALAEPLWCPSGVFGGRVFTALLGLAATLLAADSARVLARRAARAQGLPEKNAAGAIAFFAVLCFFFLSPEANYFFCIPKTYSLASLFLYAGVRCYVLQGRGACFWAGCFFAAATATRASLCFAVAGPFAAAFLCWLRRERAVREALWRSSCVFLALGFWLFITLFYAPVLAQDADSFLFSQRYHAARAAGAGGVLPWLLLRAGYISLLLQGFLPLLGGVFLGFALVVCTGKTDKKSGWPPVSLFGGAQGLALLASFCLLTLVHGLTPFPYSDYNIPAMPLAAIVVSLPSACIAARMCACRWYVPAGALLVTLCAAAASPMAMKWVGGEQKLFWFETEEQTPLKRLALAGEFLRQHARPGDEILTQDAYLAVEAGLPVVRGFEMGPFSLFPGLEEEEARARHVLNLPLLTEAISKGEARFAALSGYSFAISCPETTPLPEETRKLLRELVEARYGAPRAGMERFGQQNTPLRIYLLPEAAQASAP